MVISMAQHTQLWLPHKNRKLASAKVKSKYSNIWLTLRMDLTRANAKVCEKFIELWAIFKSISTPPSRRFVQPLIANVKLIKGKKHYTTETLNIYLVLEKILKGVKGRWFILWAFAYYFHFEKDWILQESFSAWRFITYYLYTEDSHYACDNLHARLHVSKPRSIATIAFNS